MKKDANPEKLSLLYREFWGYPLEARAVLVNELLHTQTSRADGEKWENVFNIVADRVFPNAGDEMSGIGKAFLHSYIKSRADEERTLYLSAMMVAANGNSAAADPEKEHCPRHSPVSRKFGSRRHQARPGDGLLPGCAEIHPRRNAGT